MKFTEAIEGARLRVNTMLRERKEKAEEKRAQEALNSHHCHGRFFLLHVPAAATILAAITEWYWALLFCVEATGSIDWNYETSAGNDAASASLWNFAFSTHWPVFLGLICATVPIVMLSMVWLPVQFSMRGTGRVRRGSVIAVGLLANVLVIVSGTVVMNYNRQDQVRDALVIEQTADAQRVMLTASVDDLRAELDTLMNHRSTYVATAASVGAAAYERDYVAQARATNDPRLPLLERALGSARRADELRAGIVAARTAVAQAAPAAASQANVEDTVGRELNTFAQYVEVWRPPFIAVICTLIGIFGAWWVLALMQGLNPRDVMRSGWADEGHRIEDLRAEAPVVPQPMRPTREVVTDAETGEELVKVKPREYWRKRKGKPQRVEFEPELPPDETGVSHDGGGRIGSVEGHPPDLTSPEDTGADQEPRAEGGEANEGEQQEAVQDREPDGVGSSPIHPEPPQQTEDDTYLAFVDELPPELPVEASDEQQQNDDSDAPDAESDHVELPANEGVVILESEPEEEQVQPRALIAAAE